ncbi:MAG TPA: glycosyltransferase family 4 protein [Gammaproteobacteria bacterium]|nr:glycosyltransferase family 4 protein [Gammaproteobacteria bacterium]
MTITIAHVNVARGYRGGERQTELLIREIERTGLRQVLVARRGGPLARRLSDANIEIRLVHGHPFGVAYATGGVDLLHVHEGRSVYGAYLRWLVSRTPYVITRRVNNPIRSNWLGHMAYERAACVAAVASQVAEIVRSYDGGASVRVIHSSSSGFKADAERAAAIRAAHRGKFLVGHVGALDNSQKGHEFIIAVARAVEHSNPDLHFVLVGGGDDEAMLKTAATGLTNVTFTGFVENVGDYLASFEIFILPSNREGIGSILFDAMEAGLPVIASRVGGVPDIVHEGMNGILIDPASPEQLRAAILLLRADPDLRRRFGAAGRELAKGFSAAEMARKYLDVYRDVLGGLE